jgi:hypothetical protein
MKEELTELHGIPLSELWDRYFVHKNIRFFIRSNSTFRGAYLALTENQKIEISEYRRKQVNRLKRKANKERKKTLEGTKQDIAEILNYNMTQCCFTCEYFGSSYGNASVLTRTGKCKLLNVNSKNRPTSLEVLGIGICRFHKKKDLQEQNFQNKWDSVSMNSGMQITTKKDLVKNSNLDALQIAQLKVDGDI